MGSDQRRIEATWREANDHLAADEEQLRILNESLSREGPLLERSRQEEQTAHTTFEGAETAMQSWQSDWETLSFIQLDSNNSATVQVPMFFRVVRETVDLGAYAYPFG